MNLSIRTKLSVIFLGFLILVAGAVAATFLAVEQQAAGTLVTGMVNRQQLLLHSISRSVLGVRTNVQSGEYYLDLIELDRAAGEFDRTLDALLNGGTVRLDHTGDGIEVPAATSAEVRQHLELIQSLWQPMYAAVNVLLSEATVVERSRAITEIDFRTPLLHLHTETLAHMLEAAAARNLALLKSIQVVFFLSALGLLYGGYVSVKRTILQPLESLDAATQRIAMGDLSEPVSLTQQDEIGALARSFETMRQEVATARRAYEAWTEELETRVRQRTQELAALLEISADISSKLDVDQVLASVVDKSRELLGGEVAVLCLLNESGRELNVARFSGLSEAIIRDRVKVKQGLSGDVVNRGQTVACDACSTCPILSPEHLHELIATPLRTGERIIGALCVADPEPRRLGEDAARLLKLLANSAAIALENARLYNRAETAAILAERERIAAEMHDGLAQTLGFLNLQVDQALNSVRVGNQQVVKEHLRLMQPAIQGAYDIVRQSLAGLSDNGLARCGFKAQLEACVEQFRQKCEAEVALSLDESCLPAIPDEARLQLVRILQESLVNVHRHAQAGQVRVTVEAANGSAVLIIADDGRGFDPMAVAEDGQPHLGLKIMRGRAERVGGSLIIQSRPGEGTKIIARVPLQ